MKTWQPLKGIKVLSFELAFALPAGTRALHDLGADVVRVSPPARQVNPYIGVMDGVFQGKSSISIDLTREQGREVAARLAGKADVVCNNFRPQVLRKYGLGAQTLRARHPELITLQLSGYGTPGPWSDYPAFGPSTEAAGGLNRLLVDDGEVPIRVGSAVFSDQLAGRYAALAVIAALERRKRTGTGQALDLSMTAGISHMLGQPITEALRTGRMPEALRNRDRRFVPQGVYRSLPQQTDDDEWIAISVATDAQWRVLVDLLVQSLGNTGELRGDWNPEQRWHQHDRIDTQLSALSALHTKDELAVRLQSLGVPAAPVRTTADQLLDANIRSRNMLQMVRHSKPQLGYAAHPHPLLPWRVVGRRRRKLTDYRGPGQDNKAVLDDWLQMSGAAIAQLEQQGVLHQDPELALESRRRSPGFDADHADKLGLPL